MNADEAQYVNNDDLYFDGGKDRDIYQRFEGIVSLGGYIVKDKLWFYGSFNPIIRTDKADRFFLTDAQPRPVSTFERTRTNWNGALKLTAQPMKNTRVTLSGVNNYYRYRGALPSITGSGSKAYQWADEGMDYPNMSANATVDYSPGNNLMVSLRGGYFMQDEINQQISMPETRWYFSRDNYVFQKEIPADLLRARLWTNWPGSVYETKKRKYERISSNLDFSYYMNLGGEHAWKAGIQFIRLREDVDRTAPHPLVWLNWNAPYYLMDGSRVQGKYGSYQIRGSWTSPFGSFWNIYSDNWALYLQDAWTIGEKLTLNIGVRTESEYIPSFSKEEGFKDMKPIQGGVNYTWSRLTGNYGGLASADEGGRVSPNVLRYYDLWFLAYDLKLNILEGPLPSDRSHYFKAYGSYAFPFGLTVGAVGYARTGLPLTTALNANHVVIYPNNRFDTNERLPFTMWADFYAEYNLRIAGRYRVNINLNVYNITNTSTIQGKNQTINRNDMYISDANLLSKNYNYNPDLRQTDLNPLFGLWTSRMGPWSARLGFKFTF